MPMIGRGKLLLKMENVNLDNVVLDCFKILAVQGTSKGVELKFINEIERECNKLIDSDRNRLRQILTNLIGNAIKFTIQGSITVRISEQKEEDFKINHQTNKLIRKE